MATLAASNADTLDKLKLSGVKKYDVALPTKGTKKTEKQINALLKKIPYKPAGKGSTTYNYCLDFARLPDAKPGNYMSASTTKTWNKYYPKTKYTFSYSEMKNLINPGEGILCILSKRDAKYYYSYDWIKNEKTGTLYKSKIPTDDVGPITTYIPTNYRLYPDETVLGEKCMVYSYDIMYTDQATTFYRYISRKTGVCVKLAYSEPYTLAVTLYFEYKLMDKADSFFNPPKDVKFKTFTGAPAPK
jgi:hypothetical protein